MNKNEAAITFGEGANTKFLIQVMPPLFYMWKFNADEKPLHVDIAYQLNLLDETFNVKPGIKAGKAKVKEGDFVLTGGSSDFPEAKASQMEFETALQGDITII